MGRTKHSARRSFTAPPARGAASAVTELAKMNPCLRNCLSSHADSEVTNEPGPVGEFPADLGTPPLESLPVLALRLRES